MSDQQSNKQLRSFGLIVGTGFAVIALWPLIRGRDLRLWALIISLVLYGTALIAPRALRSFFRVWMILGETLGWVNSRIILCAVYYLILVPIAFVRKMMGEDPMKRKFEPDSATYKILRTKRPGSHIQQQY